MQDTLVKADVFDGNEFVCCTLSVWVEQLVDLLNQLNDENEQLKQRNKRQAKHLAELYELMAKKDWKSLTEIIDDFCSCEE